MAFEFSDNGSDVAYVTRRAPLEPEALAGGQFTAHDVAMCSSDEARTFLSSADAIALHVLPLALTRGHSRLSLHCAVADDSDRMRAKLRFLCGLEVSLTIVPREVLEQAIPKAYFGSELRLRQYIDRIAVAPKVLEEARKNRATPSTPVAKGDAAQFLTAILEFAAVRGASDLHLSPGVDSVIAKMRIDGELCSLEGNPYDKSFHEQVVTRLKVLAELDVTNRRLPQDGAFRFMVGSTQRSARVSTLPSVHGESVVVRFLDGQTIPEIGSLGLEPTTLLVLRSALERTEGLILLTGPTGSGKTTTMYSVVRELASRGRHVVSAEDPVENPLAGVVQVQVCTEQGLDYPRAIRSVLRHDPDVLLIGEVRDGISAAMALDAASTGHLTISSLHVGSSLQAIGRLEVLGVPRSRSIPPIALVVNQRLVPRLCGSCKQPEGAPRSTALGTIYRAVGCDACAGSGYRGRVLVTELLDIQNQRAKDACYRATTTTELLDLLPVGASIPWIDSLQHHLLRGDISLAQVEQFVAAEMV
jgi:type II secretory ATPase GspE/PulE/Tfp pilus assembly ATPase PilB-like protein